MARSNLSQARSNRDEMMLEQTLDAILLSAKTVTPAERKKLLPLLKYYAKFKKPFTKCYNDNVKRWGPELTKKRCAVIKDLIMGTTKWRKGRQSANMSDDDIAMHTNAPYAGDDVIAIIDRLTENQIEQIEDVIMAAAFSEDDTPDTCVYLHLSDNTPIEEEEVTLSDGKTAKVLWKDVLVEGEYPMSPSAGGATDEPMRVIAEGESNPSTKTISMSDLVYAHNDGAFKYVTVPTSHRDQLLDNTGFVPRPNGVRVIEKNGRKVFQAALGFTEPDIKGKVQRGTIPDVSGGIFFNWLNKHTKKTYRAAMKHVALTPVPFMGNLDPFPAVFASDDEFDKQVNIEVYEFAEPSDALGTGEPSPPDTKSGEIVWDETQGANWVRSSIQNALRPATQPEDGRPVDPAPYYHIQDITSDRALVEEDYKGTLSRFVVPFKVVDGKIELAPQTRWVEAKPAMIAASDFTSVDDISMKLSDQLDKDFGAGNFRVVGMSLDNRARIENAVEGGVWEAKFTVFSDSEVALAPPTRWEQVEKPQPKEEETKQPVSSKPVATVKLSDPIMARLEVARQKRRQKVAQPTIPYKGGV